MTTDETLNPTQPAPVQPAKRRAAPRDYLELVKFSHTIFALPFALAAMLVAQNGLPQARIIGWILVAMIGARTAAMGFNRIVDREIDAKNPRTASREIPSGKVSVFAASVLVFVSAALFVFAAWQLNILAAILSLPTLGVLFFYSYCKRFTSFAHFVLGVCLGIAPCGAWVAVRGKVEIAPVVLALAVMFWVAGFDMIYATMDDEFDRAAGLRSMVQRLGVRGALQFARLSHALFAIFLFLFGYLAALGTVYYIGAALISAVLVYEHALVSPRDLRRVNAAFFTVNGAISVAFSVMVALSLWLRR